MKKRIFSLLIALVMLFQITPVFAAEEVTVPIMIDSVEDLFSLNDNLNADAVLTTNLELVIDDAFVERYGASSIGELMPYTGSFNGNNHTITIDVTTDKKSYGLFNYLNGANIYDLTVFIDNFHTTSTSSNISFAGLAHIVRNSNIRAGVIYVGNVNGKPLFVPGVKHRNVTIGSIASNCGGVNEIDITYSMFHLRSLPDDADVVFGAAAVISDGETTVNNLDKDSDSDLISHATVSIPAKMNSYIVGGLIGEIKNDAVGKTTGDGYVIFSGNSSSVDESKIGLLKTIIGGNIGYINEGGRGFVSYGNGNYVKTEISTFGYSNEFTLGGYVGFNDGYASVQHTSSSLYLSGDVVKYNDDRFSENAIINIGGILGKNSGEFINHSTAVNNNGKKIDAKNAVVNMGSILGYNEGTSRVSSSNNGISFQVSEVKGNINSSFGYMIGKIDDSSNVNVSYNIINAVDENSFKGDYYWIEGPFGGINENSRVSGFKNNYWGYMDYAEIGKPSQIYFMIPMNYFGDTPPEMEDPDFPFLAVYDYLDYDNENNKFLSFQNKSGNGIGTLTLIKDCLVGTRVRIDVVGNDSLYGWSGHYYLYDDILGKAYEDKDDELEDDKDDDSKDSEEDSDEKDDLKDKEDDKEQEEDKEDKEDKEDNEDKEDKDDELEDDKDEDEEEENPEDKDEKDKKDRDSKNDEYFGPEEYLRDFNQAVITDENGKGEPLPTFNESENSIVKFNYHELNYEFVKNDIKFDDIKNEKYRRDIIQAANRLIVRGVGDNKFEPARPITRAEFAAMVVRALGLLPIGDPEFEDVSKDKWYYDYVNAAATWEIVYGVGDNKFEPEDNITREEAMLILTRAAENIVMENDFDCIFKDAFSFIAKDTDEFSDWAYEGYRDNLKYGIVSMRDSYKSAPKEPITRAETANAILNLLRNFALIDYTR